MSLHCEIDQTRENIMTDYQSTIGENAVDYRTSGGREDKTTAMIEAQTSKVPSSGYLGAALGAMAASAVLNLSGKKHWALFVGQWAAPFLLMGIYNKMVKQHGSDAESRAAY